MKNKIFTKEEIRHYLIRHFGLEKLDSYGRGKDGILNYIRKVSCLQQDPLNIVGTNIDIILASRFSDYSPKVLRQILYKDQLLIEGWDKEASVYLSSEWGELSFVRQKLEEGSLGTIYYRHQEEALNYVEEVKEILQKSSIPISSRELNLGTSSKSRWGSANLGSIALSHLWSRGDAIIADRDERRKLYKSSAKLETLPHFENEEEFLFWYIYRRLSGLGAYWLKNGSSWLGYYMSERKRVVSHLEEIGKVVMVNVEGLKDPLCLTDKNYKELVQSCKSLDRSRSLRFIAPLDNFIWDRKFVKEIFGFDYIWEVYKPVEKRQYGYYVLPILYGDRFIGRIEPERDKARKNTLEIKNIWFESELYDTPEVNKKIISEVERYNSIFIKRRDDKDKS